MHKINVFNLKAGLKLNNHFIQMKTSENAFIHKLGKIRFIHSQNNFIMGFNQRIHTFPCPNNPNLDNILFS